MAQKLILPTTAAATSQPFTCSGKNNMSFCCNSLQGSETMTLQVYDSANAVWADAKYKTVLYQITVDSNFMSISEDVQTYRFVKSITANAIGLNTNSDIQLGYLDGVPPTA